MNFVPAIWRAKSCHFSGTKSVIKTARWRIVCTMLRHVVSSVTHKLQNVHEMRYTQCHACALNEKSSWQVVTTCKNFLNISKFLPRPGTHYFTWPASPRIPTHTVTSSFLTGTPNYVPRSKPFIVSLWGLLKAPRPFVYIISAPKYNIECRYYLEWQKLTSAFRSWNC